MKIMTREELLLEMKKIPDDGKGDCLFRSVSSGNKEIGIFRFLFMKEVLESLSKNLEATLVKESERVYRVEDISGEWLFCFGYEQAKAFQHFFYQEGISKTGLWSEVKH
jgi:hypothetical protein